MPSQNSSFLVMAIIVLLPCWPAQAQQASARGMNGNMDLMRLEKRLKVLEVNNARMHACQAQGKLYAPTDKNTDDNGCVSSGLHWGEEIPPTAPSCAYFGHTVILGTGKIGVVHGRLAVAYTGKTIQGMGCFEPGEQYHCIRTYDGAMSDCSCSTTVVPADGCQIPGGGGMP